jgi:hypothetical protein
MNLCGFQVGLDRALFLMAGARGLGGAQRRCGQRAMGARFPGDL